MPEMDSEQGKNLPVGPPAPEKKKTLVGRILESVESNAVKAIGAGALLLFGLAFTTMRDYADSKVQTFIDGRVGDALKDGKAAHQIIAGQLHASYASPQFQAAVTKAIEDEAKKVDGQKVGAITSGTLILTPSTKPQAIYVYLPAQSSRGLLWLKVHSPYPSQNPSNPNDTGVRLLFDNSFFVVIDRVEETPLRLNDLFEQAAKGKAASQREKFDPISQIPTISASQMMSPVQTRLGDIHSI